jgi:hypothetical protein
MIPAVRLSDQFARHRIYVDADPKLTFIGEAQTEMNDSIL